MKRLFTPIISLYILLAALSCSSLHKNNTVVQNQGTGNYIYQADPTIFYDKGTYYLYGTNERNADSGFKVFISKDLLSWQLSRAYNGWALTKGNAYGTKGFWAPQVFHYKDKYY